MGILKALDHPNIVQIYEVYKDDKRFYIVTEFCEGGEVFDEIVERGQFTEKYAAMILR
jgi:calcium-dependent protein kinase